MKKWYSDLSLTLESCLITIQENTKNSYSYCAEDMEAYRALEPLRIEIKQYIDLIKYLEQPVIEGYPSIVGGKFFLHDVELREKMNIEIWDDYLQRWYIGQVMSVSDGDYFFSNHNFNDITKIEENTLIRFRVTTPEK